MNPGAAASFDSSRFELSQVFEVAQWSLKVVFALVSAVPGRRNTGTVELPDLRGQT